MPRSQRITSSLPSTKDVLGGQQQVVQTRGRASLEQHRPAGPPELREQRVVVHVAGADLDDIGHPEDGVQLAYVGELGDHGEPGPRAGLAQQHQAGAAEAWKLRGLVRGLKAPPRNMVAPAAATHSAVVSVCSRDSTAHGPAIRVNSAFRMPAAVTLISVPRRSSPGCARP
jgi:hypothetical protein